MTAIADLLNESTTVSFEFFPPKSDAEEATLSATTRAVARATCSAFAVRTDSKGEWLTSLVSPTTASVLVALRISAGRSFTRIASPWAMTALR